MNQQIEQYVYIFQMQQVLHLLFLNHRKSLNYPENQIDLNYRPSYKQVLIKQRQKYMVDHDNIKAYRQQYGSVDLNARNRKARPEIEMDGDPLVNMSANNRNNKSRSYQKQVSEQEQKLIKKYNHDFSGYKQSVQLPKISQSSRSKAKNEKYNHNVSAYSNKNSIETPVYKPPKQRQRNQHILRKAKRKLRKCINSIIFIKRIQKLLRINIKRTKQISQLSQNLHYMILSMINNYYANQRIMKDALLQYGEILKRKISNKQYKATLDIVNNLSDITQCLKISSIRNDMLKFLTLLTFNNTNNYCLPCDFFCEFELMRLQFDKKKFRLIKITDQQIKMVVGMFLGVKILCNQLFYQPWNVKLLGLPTKLSVKIKPIVWAYTSYIQTVITRMFANLPVYNEKNSIAQTFEGLGVKPMRFQQQNQQFYNKLDQKYNKLNQRIVANIRCWVDRITNQVIKNRQKLSLYVDANQNEYSQDQ